MVLFSDREKIVEKYKEWLEENPERKECTESLISFMITEGLIKDKHESDFYYWN